MVKKGKSLVSIARDGYKAPPGMFKKKGSGSSSLSVSASGAKQFERAAAKSFFGDVIQKKKRKK